MASATYRVTSPRRPLAHHLGTIAAIEFKAKYVDSIIGYVWSLARPLAYFVIMGGGVRPPEYFRTLRGRALEATNLLTDEESAIKELVAAKGLQPSFSFLPFTADTGEIYSALDVVTFPNLGVALGRPVLGAATYGELVVASGSRDGAGILLPGRTGFLLDDTRPHAIAGALRELIEDAALRNRLGESAVEHARERFDPLRNAWAVEAIYDELLGLEPERVGPREQRATARISS